MSTFVTLGNGTQPFGRLLAAVTEAYDLLPRPVIVQHGNTPYSGPGDRVVAFLPMDEFARILEGAELVIAHGGAGTILHALSAGKTPLVMPRRAVHREIVDDHQLELTAALEEAGRIVVAHDAAALAAAVRDRRLAPVARASTANELVAEIGALLSSGKG